MYVHAIMPIPEAKAIAPTRTVMVFPMVRAPACTHNLSNLGKRTAACVVIKVWKHEQLRATKELYEKTCTYIVRPGKHTHTNTHTCTPPRKFTTHSRMHKHEATKKPNTDTHTHTYYIKLALRYIMLHYANYLTLNYFTLHYTTFHYLTFPYLTCLWIFVHVNHL